MVSKVQGLDRLKRQLASLPNSVRAAVDDALAKNAAEMADSIERAAPVADGDLRRSVGWSQGEPPPTSATGAFRIRRKDMSARQGILADAGLLYSVYAGDDVAFYARFVEFGTAPGTKGMKVASNTGGRRSRKVARTHPGTRAQPFFFPVIRSKKRLVKNRVARAARKAMKEIAGLSK
jgi:HK97 gp10 family phage protein